MNKCYKIELVDVDGHATANGVMVNSRGAWLGDAYTSWHDGTTEQMVQPYADEDGDYIPAPSNWRDLVIPATTTGEGRDGHDQARIGS